jgi:hypothetical protein
MSCGTLILILLSVHITVMDCSLVLIQLMSFLKCSLKNSIRDLWKWIFIVVMCKRVGVVCKWNKNSKSFTYFCLNSVFANGISRVPVLNFNSVTPRKAFISDGSNL